jgi:pimeloyl-ACP methyl ester carboxylesterase
MATTSTSHRYRETTPTALAELVERFDPSVIDVRGGRARIRLAVEGDGEWDALIDGGELEIAPASADTRADAVLRADTSTWTSIASDVRGGMDAFRRRRLLVRDNLHLGVGFLAATSGNDTPGRLRFESVDTARGRISLLRAGVGAPVVCLHGLGGTKASFLPTVAALASDEREVIAFDFPGSGDSDKPLTAAYDAPYFASSAVALLDALEIGRADLIGNSMGGRVAIEAGFRSPERIRRLALLSPALAWLRDRPWKWLLQLPVARLGLIQPTPRPIAEAIVRRVVPGGSDGWSAAGVDEFMRAYLDPRGRAAFYAAAANIYLDEPYGEDGLWTRLAELAPETLFVWGRNDKLVPIAFMKHVERTLPAARHVELDCGHVPQLERPRETHQAIRDFFSHQR